MKHNKGCVTSLNSKPNQNKSRDCSNYPKCDWTEDWQEFGQIIDNRK